MCGAMTPHGNPPTITKKYSLIPTLVSVIMVMGYYIIVYSIVGVGALPLVTSTIPSRAAEAGLLSDVRAYGVPMDVPTP